MAQVGLIGLGRMGSGIAASLLRAGHAVTVTAHRKREALERLIKHGAREARTPHALAASSEVIVLSLPGSPEVTGVIETLKPALRPGQMIIDTSTSMPRTEAVVNQLLAESGVGFVDAPVTGMPISAERGELISLVGADDKDIATVRPILKGYSRRIEHMGPAGAGYRTKLINNTLTVGVSALVIEVFRRAHADGLDWRQLYDFMQTGLARSGILDVAVLPALDGDYTGQPFSLANALKDVTYIRDYLETGGQPCPAAQGVVEFYRQALDANSAQTIVSALLDPENSIR